MIRSCIGYWLKKRRLKARSTILASRHVALDCKIGNNCLIGKKAYIAPEVKIANYTYINSNHIPVIIESKVEIGSFCSIAPGVVIGLGNHRTDLVSTHPILFNPYYLKALGQVKQELLGLIDKDLETVIANDVWLGMNANIKRGVKIGNGAIIAAGAYVTKDVPPYSVVAGVPAKIIKYRFSSEQIKELEEIDRAGRMHWSLNQEELAEVFPLLYRVDKFILKQRLR